jgi:redox-sensitive bicupin YhaK (pirin superfamily)
MEIVTYVLEGALKHRDNMGSESVLRPGDVQRMSAGAGVTHSEFNYSESESLHFLQIWVHPEGKGITPSYEEKSFPNASKQDQLRMIVSPDGADGSLKIHQDVRIFASLLATGSSLTHRLEPERHAWVQVALGSVIVNGHLLQQGDGASFSEVSQMTFDGKNGEFILFDLA